MKAGVVFIVWGCLTIWLIVLHQLSPAPSPPSVLSQLHVRIVDGAFEWQPVGSDMSPNQQTELRVHAGQPIAVRLTSTDFVYVVRLPCIDRAVLVLPQSSTDTVVTLPEGDCHMNVVQGCGSLFPSHSSELVLHAVE